MHDFVEVAAPTRQCITVMDEATGAVTELVEESRAVSTDDYQRLLAIVTYRLPGCQAMVMAGTLTPGGPVDFYARVLAGARGHRPITLVDTQGPVLLAALAARPGVVKPNRHELAAATGRTLTDDAAVFSAMRELQARGAQAVIITAGQAPALVSDGQSHWRIAPPVITAVNPIGSGDAFTAALVASLVRGDDLAEACRRAAAAGAANALTLMAGEVDPGEVTRLLGETRAERLHPPVQP
jgi:tagatose 6-phosphate kinase